MSYEYKDRYNIIALLKTPDRSTASDKGFGAESRVFLVLSKRAFSVRRRRVHYPEELEKTPIKRAP